MRYKMHVWIDESSYCMFSIREDMLMEFIDFCFERDLKIVRIEDEKV